MKDRAERKIRYSVAPTNFDEIILKFYLISAEYYFVVILLKLYNVKSKFKKPRKA